MFPAACQTAREGWRSSWNFHGLRKDEFSGFCAYARGRNALYSPPQASAWRVSNPPPEPRPGRIAGSRMAVRHFQRRRGSRRGGSARCASRPAATPRLRRRRMLLRKGDEAYQAGRYAEAVEAYAGAREMIPDAPVSAELRRAATERYAQASVEQARNSPARATWPEPRPPWTRCLPKAWPRMIRWRSPSAPNSTIRSAPTPP